MSAVSSRVVRFHQTGEPADVLRQESAEVADPPARNVRVGVLAVGLNPADWELCRGFMPGPLPRGIGYDVAGIVDTVGDGIDDVCAGDVVFGTADFVGQPSAGAADVAILDTCFRVPEQLDPIQAATLPMVTQTAAWTLELLDIAPGDTLLVHGAGGMVGYAAVQIALRHGLRVIATAGATCTSDLEGFGAQVTPYGDGMAERVRDLAHGNVDVVLDTPRPSPGVMSDLIALTGGDARRVMTISNHAEARQLGARVNLDEMHPGLTPVADLLPLYAQLAARGQFRLPIAKTYPLGRWRDAMQLSLSGKPHGKVVLLPNQDDPNT